MAAAHRPRIDAAVSDAIVEAANSDAIAALLANPSAQIRESTLDALVAQAGQHAGWQEPLVRRPCLPSRTARALSEIVTNHLLEVLFARDDLDPDLAYDLRDQLKRPARNKPTQNAPVVDAAAQALRAEATALNEAGRLNNESVLLAAQRGDIHLVSAMLSVKAGVPIEVIERASALRSAKGLVSLSWKAGLSMQVALALQVVVARLQPDSIIQPRAGGGFPMSIQEMRWQLEFLSRTDR